MPRTPSGRLRVGSGCDQGVPGSHVRSPPVIVRSMNDTTSPNPPGTPKRLVRDPDNMIGGVAAGIAHHLDIDVTLVRLAFVLAFLTVGFGPLLYIVAWILMPMSPHPLGRTDRLGGALA